MSEEDLSTDVRNTLYGLREKGYCLSIGSSSKNTKFILEKLGLKDFFDEISDGTNITKSKPDPEVFLKAAEFMNYDPKDCLVIEDAHAGIQAATAAGMDSAGIGDASLDENATYKLNKLSDLLSIL